MQECGVCLQLMDQAASHRLPCGHSFHANCLVPWFREPRSRGQCPLCRAAPPSAEPNQHFAINVELEMAELSPRIMHRLLAPCLFHPTFTTTPAQRRIVDHYMACRRKYIQSAGAEPARKRLMRAARSMLVLL